ncbi:MAG: PD-(D/E)XK nuclease family transposase [Spirochaetales bacterium]|nr:PD-(D/E)XK nuclease family transposase [Spirochaetales bacterium]
MDIYVKPTSDIFFRYLFGSEKNKKLLLSFINSVMEDVNFPILSSLEIKNPFNLKTITFEKESILDIKALDESGRQYDIEVQSTGDESFKARSLYYWAKLYASQLGENEFYKTLKPTICINILDFNLLANIPGPHNCFMLHEIKNPEFVLTDHLMIHFLELPKLDITLYNTKIQRWLVYLKSEGKEEDIMTILIREDKEIEEAHKICKKFTRDEEMLELYEARQKFKRDFNSIMAAKIEEAEKKGKLDGKLENQLDTAKKMKMEGDDSKKIARITGLTVEEIEQL